MMASDGHQFTKFNKMASIIRATPIPKTSAALGRPAHESPS
jgi:hypothetical protein